MAKKRVAPRRIPSRRAAAPVTEECRRLLALLRQRCPGLVPPDPLNHGSVGPELTLKREEVSRLVTAAALDGGPTAVVWARDDSELIVHVGKVSVQLGAGLVLVTIPVQCTEARTALVQVPFAVGDDKRPAGLLVATEERPRGPAAVVDVWGDALAAFAWKALLAMAAGVSAAAGTDESGAGLIPAALTANADVLRVQTMARFAFDRVAR